MHGDETRWVCIARLTEQHGIHDGEDRRIDADPDREVEDGDQRKARTPGCRPDCIAQVVVKMVCCSHVSVRRRRSRSWTAIMGTRLGLGSSVRATIRGGVRLPRKPLQEEERKETFVRRLMSPQLAPREARRAAHREPKSRKILPPPLLLFSYSGFTSWPPRPRFQGATARQPPYSARSVIDGSTRAARHAGTAEAMNDTPTSAATTPA